MKFVVKARLRASSRDEQYYHLCSQLMCCKHGLQKQRYALPRIHILWRLPYACLLAVAGDTCPQNTYSNQSKRQSTAKIWEGSEGMGRCGRCPTVSVSEVFILCLYRMNDQRLMGCICPFIGSWLVLFGLFFCKMVLVSLVICANSRSAASLQSKIKCQA